MYIDQCTPMVLANRCFSSVSLLLSVESFGTSKVLYRARMLGALILDGYVVRGKIDVQALRSEPVRASLMMHLFLREGGLYLPQ
ncbi:hypothetical protein PTW37_03525 [Arthrobacter agilis]|uniref:hypothetical protein n=1 Tax=Arthrobacter agilis TaxID=37921 RepID=UPI002366231B|nr:hypothetical protein [Arthrobacter agilis]WDF34010.1 hypothetical protein PTW37_03525 [Arthrobacter agilis]